MNAFFNTHQRLYAKDLPPVYPKEEIPSITMIEKSYDVILAELQSVLSNPTLREQAFRKRRYAKSPNWKQIELMIYGLRYPKKMDLFPKTMEVLNKIEGVSTIYFSFLSPHSDIQSHNGDTDAFYRIHLGVNVPDTYPTCGMKVGGQPLSWENGKCFAFNDIYFHSSWNHSERERVVLIIDVIRPEFQKQHLKINAGVIATLILSRSYLYIGVIIELFPRLITRAVHPILHFMIYHYFRFLRGKRQ